MNIMIVDYEKAVECQNNKAWYICTKCGQCGRKFEKGFMVDKGGTTVEESEKE